MSIFLQKKYKNITNCQFKMFKHAIIKVIQTPVKRRVDNDCNNYLET